MNEPHSWFRDESERKVNDLEALNAPLFSKGKTKTYRCILLDKECMYNSTTGAGDCRRCNFALAYLTANPDYVRNNIGSKK